jgi:hypothetical protein
MAVVKAAQVKSTLAKAVKYVINPVKTNGYEPVSTSTGQPVDDPNAITDVYLRNLNRSGGAKRRGRVLAHHIIQSFDPDDPITAGQAHELGVRFIREAFSGEYDYVIATHTDRPHLQGYRPECVSDIGSEALRRKGLAVFEMPWLHKGYERTLVRRLRREDEEERDDQRGQDPVEMQGMRRVAHARARPRGHRPEGGLGLAVLQTGPSGVGGAGPHAAPAQPADVVAEPAHAAAGGTLRRGARRRDMAAPAGRRPDRDRRRACGRLARRPQQEQPGVGGAHGADPAAQGAGVRRRQRIGKAMRTAWPGTRMQRRCLFHICMNITVLTGKRPKLEAGRELLGLAQQLSPSGTPA